MEAIPSEGSVCLQKQPLETALQLELCVYMLIANVCGSFEVTEGGQGDIDIRMTIYLLLTKLQCANGGWWPNPLTTNSRCCYMYIYVDQICGYWLQICHNSLKCHLWCLHVEDHSLGTPSRRAEAPVTVTEELVAMTTSGDDTSEGAKGEAHVHVH